MDNALREKAVFEALKNKDWSSMLEHAKRVPSNWNTFDRLPSAGHLPDEVVNSILDHLSSKGQSGQGNLSGFIYEMAHNLPGDPSRGTGDRPPYSRQTMNRLANLAMDDNLSSHMILNHPHFSHDEKNEGLIAATDFWHGYEKNVEPKHFAVIKSLFTNNPETVNDHRGQSGSSSEHMHLLPHLKNHAREVQKKIMEDDSIPKKYFRGEPYVQLHRGVNGHYGKIIRDKAKYSPDTNEVDKKTFSIPTAHLTSWTTDPQTASRFAWSRGAIEGQPEDQGVVLSQWHPVKNILHSGFHRTVPGQEFVHGDEAEIVVGHPEAKYKISTSNMKFQEPLQYRPDTPEDKKHIGSAQNYGQVSSPRLRKAENDNNFIDLHDLMTASLDSQDVLILEKNMKKLVPAVTALALLGSPQDSRHTLPHDSMPGQVQQTTELKPVQSIQTMGEIYPGLKPIKMIESSGGKNTSHKLLENGPHAGTRAYGSYGLMPMLIVETINKTPSLKSKYPEIADSNAKDNDKIHNFMASNPSAEIEIANAHWNKLRHVFGGNKDKMAYAWLNGIGGAKRATDEDIANHPYVQKYRKYKQMIDVENVKKSETAHGVTKFIPFSDSKSARDINLAIQSGQVHELSNTGKFSHDAFVAGFFADNSWLIKLEPEGRHPAIDSAKYGLQTIKEAAFYLVAKKVFNLDQYTPHAILGEAIKHDSHRPAVAIKMYPEAYISTADANESRPGSVRPILEKMLKTGDLHRIAAMLYILGDGDAHGGNTLTDGSSVKIIDHGTSFADKNFDTQDENVFIPYILRAWGYKDSMTSDEKYQTMPRISNPAVEENLRHWLHNLSAHDLAEILKPFNIDPRPSIERLESMQKMARRVPVDVIVNSLWTRGKEGL